MNRMSKRATALGTATIAVMGAGLAYAAWTADGTGSGTVQAVTAQAVTTVAATTSPDLFPTGDGDLLVKVANSNPYAVTVTAITQTASTNILSGDSTCDGVNGAANGVTFTDATGLTAVVPAGSSGTLITLPNAVHMSNNSVTACSGQTFTVPVDIAAASS